MSVRRPAQTFSIPAAVAVIDMRALTKTTEIDAVLNISLPRAANAVREVHHGPLQSRGCCTHAQSRYLRNTHPALPASMGTIFDHTFPEAIVESVTITLVSLCKAPRIVPFGRLRIFSGVPVGSATMHSLLLLPRMIMTPVA